ncbi:hypothetical protein FO519_004685 [Halicephalobus sp. NKZ332]|nr:hypothetical protein FO519_004685 [Halicephalobus sp. NKZ332]
MKTTVLLPIFFLIIGSANGQIAAWPATSYSPFFDAMFRAAASPVAAFPSGPGLQAPAIPVPGPILAAAPIMAPAPVFAPPAPVFAPPAPVFAAPPPAPVVAPAPVIAAYAPTIFAPSAGYFVPKVIPAPYGPFGRPAVSYGSNKNKQV